METRYCIEYINPRFPLLGNGTLNVRHDRVRTLEEAEHDLTLILSFGGKILNLYMGNVVEGKIGEWTPKPMIVNDDDWFSDKWLNTLEVKEVDSEKVFNDEYSKFSNDVDAMDYGFPIDLADYKDFAKHFFELGLKVQK